MFGKYIRSAREVLKKSDRRFSLRQVAGRIAVEPAYLSKVEREEVAPPSEKKICLLAGELGMDEDLLLSKAGKVSGELQEIIRHRPRIISELLRALKDAPDAFVEELSSRAGEKNWG